MFRHRLFAVFALSFPAAALVRAAELQHLWNFETVDAPLADSASGVSGALGTPATVTYVEGRAPGTLALRIQSTVAGPGDYVLLPGTNPAMFSPGTQAFSMSLWFRLPADSSVTRGIMDFSGNGGDGMQLLLTSANALNFRVDGSGTYNLVASIPGAIVEDNTWHFLAAVYDPTLTSDTLKIYLDGSAVSATASRDTTAAATVQLSAGCWLGTFNFANASEPKGLDGDLDELAYYSGTLAPAQIAELQAGTLQPAQIASPLPDLNITHDPSTGQVELSWQSMAENYYTVWSTDDPGSWTRLTATPLQGSGAVLNYQNHPGSPRRFYRLRRF